jgi:Cu(I)/Ag(I) efflux system membrane fusion protein
MWIDADVPEAQARLLAVGSQARVTPLDAPAQEMIGQVRSILPEINVVSRTQTVRLSVDDWRRNALIGRSFRVHLTSTDNKDRLLVPDEAVIPGADFDQVIVVLAPGWFELQEVRLGMRGDRDVEILAGLAPGQTVVTSGQFLLTAEANVRSLPVRRLTDAVAAGDAQAR